MPTQKRAARPKRKRPEPPYFLENGAGGTVTVYRRPCGNRALPKQCGVMPSRAMATALVAQLSRAERAVDDLFLEATDDGIEALEAILEACRQSVIGRTGAAGRAKGKGRRRRRRPGEGS
jgi:hypothetical protein